MAKREAVSTKARLLKSDLSTAPNFGSFEKIHQHENEESYRAFQAQRRELYAILAVITDRVIDNAIVTAHERPPFGLATPVGGAPDAVGSFSHFKFGLNATLMQSYRLVAGEPDLAPAIGRLEGVLPFFLGGEGDFRYQTAETLLKSGVGTASKITIDSMKAIARFAQDQKPTLGPEELANIARNSSSVVQKVAAVGISQLTAAEVLIANAERPGNEILTLKTNSSGQDHVDFAKPVGSMPNPLSHPRFGLAIGDLKGQNEVLGCPALIRFQGVNGLEKLWQWVVSVGEQNGFFASICNEDLSEAFV